MNSFFASFYGAIARGNAGLAASLWSTRTDAGESAFRQIAPFAETQRSADLAGKVVLSRAAEEGLQALKAGNTTETEIQHSRIASVLRRLSPQEYLEVAQRLRETPPVSILEKEAHFALGKSPLEVTIDKLPGEETVLRQQLLGLIVYSEISLDRLYELKVRVSPDTDIPKLENILRSLFVIDPRLTRIMIQTNGTENARLYRESNGTLFVEGKENVVPLPETDEIQPLFDLDLYSREQVLREKMLAAILGGVVADAIGTPVEFTTREERKSDPVREMRDGGTHGKPPGTFSDDSSMTLSLLESMRVAGFDPAYQGLNYLRWRFGGHWTADGDVFDVGFTTNQALLRLASGVEAVQAGQTDEQSNGNGSLMRSLPLIFYNIFGGEDFLSDDSLSRLFEQSAVASRVTHAHPRSQLGCAIYTILGRFLVAGFSLDGALQKTKEAVQKNLKAHAEMVREWQHYERIFAPDFKRLPEDEIKTSPYVVSTLEAAVWTLLNTDTYREAVETAVNLGGDTDTVAMVTGGLAGILHGREAIPEEWLSKVARIEEITAFVESSYHRLREQKRRDRVAEDEKLGEILEAADAAMEKNDWKRAIAILGKPFPGVLSVEPRFFRPEESCNELLIQLQALARAHVDELIYMLNESRDHRDQSAVAVALGWAGTQKALEALQGEGVGLNHSTWMTWRAAGFGLAMNGSREALDLLRISLLHDAPQHIKGKTHVAKVLDKVPSPARMNLIRELCEKSPEGIRSAAEAVRIRMLHLNR